MSTTRHLSRLVASLGLVAALALPASVMAAPASSTTHQSTNLGCGLLEAEGASGYLYHAHAGGSESGAWLEIWLAPANPIFDPPTMTSTDASLVLSPDGSSLSGTIDLSLRGDGSSAGTANLAALLTAVGPVETNQRSTTNGNQKIHEFETAQNVAVAGSITLPSGEVLALDECFGSTVITEVTKNNPRSQVEWGKGTGIKCDWYLEDGLYVGLMGQGDRTLTWIDIAVVTPDGSFLGSDEEATLGRTGLEASVTLAGGGYGIASSGGTAHASARVHNGARSGYTEGSGSSRMRLTVEDFIVEGTLSVLLDDGTALNLDMSVCRMSGFSERAIQGGNG